MTDPVPPQSIIIGLTKGEWPMIVFGNDKAGRSQALHWIAEKPNRRLWECGILNPRELEYIPPGEAKLVRKQ